MLKKIIKGTIGSILIGVSLIVGLIVLLDKNEEKLYDKFGKEKVLEFMKPFEPFIVMDPDKGEEDTLEEIDEVLEEATIVSEEVLDTIEEVLEEV